MSQFLPDSSISNVPGFDPGPPRISKARYIMIGGFLGAGKTTSVLRLARHLREKKLRVGLITNDQGNGLVDTALLRSNGFATEEIAGGCFCCRFNSLLEAAEKLSSEKAPEVFIAEPVGSCTDLLATVSYPLRRLYGNTFTIAPLSVVVDPVRAARIFGLEEGARFSEKVIYIYRKQLEEADLIVINKCDVLTAEALCRLQQELSQAFPRASVLAVSARTGTGLDGWFAHLERDEQHARAAMEIDYDTYGEGERLLGWLNATVQLSSTKDFDGNHVLRNLAGHVQAFLKEKGREVAHFKMTLSPDDGLGELGVINLVRNDFVPELSQELSDQVESGQLILNLRAEASPEELNQAVTRALTAAGNDEHNLFIRIDHLEHFRPGKPQPVHRVQE
jgi:G3E family GTPase